MVLARPKILQPIEMSIETDPAQIAESNARHADFMRNSDWLKEYATEVYSANRGKVICIAGQQVYAAERAEDAWAIAKAAHPKDKGIVVHFIPLIKAPRI